MTTKTKILKFSALQLIDTGRRCATRDVRAGVKKMEGA